MERLGSILTGRLPRLSPGSATRVSVDNATELPNSQSEVAVAAELLRVRREYATCNEHDAVFATRNGTWHQVVNVERRWRQIRKDTGYEWVTPHTFRKTVATLISEATTSELASRQLGIFQGG